MDAYANSLTRMNDLELIKELHKARRDTRRTPVWMSDSEAANRVATVEQTINARRSN